MKRSYKFIVLISLLVVIAIVAIFIIFFRESSGGEAVSSSETRTFDPFGLLGSSGIAVDDFVGEDVTVGSSAQTLSLLHDRPTTKAVFVNDKLVRFVERETGHVFDVNTDTLQRIRVSNTTIPRTSQVLWGGDPNNLIYRYLDDAGESVETFVGTIRSSSSTEPSTDGYFLEKDIFSITRSPSTENLFYTSNDGSFIYNPESRSLVRVFTLGLKSLLAQWVNPSLVFLSTKPSYESPGFLFSLNPNTGTIKEVLGGVLGATTLSDPGGNTVLYSYSSGNNFGTFLLDRNSNTSKKFSVETLPEKCVWGSDEVLYCAVPNHIPNNLPDEWYQGLVSFEDSIWKIYTGSGETELLIANTDFSVGPVDAVDLVINENQNLLLFRNRYNSSLWMLRIED